MPRMPPRLPALVPGPGWLLQPPPLLSSSLTLNCLYSTQQPAGSLLKLSQIMSFLCSNLPIFRSEEELKSLQAAWDFTPRFPDLLSHFFTPRLPLRQPHWPPCYFSSRSGTVLLRGLCTGCAPCLDPPSRGCLHGASHASSLQANVVFSTRPTLFLPISYPLPPFFCSTYYLSNLLIYYICCWVPHTRMSTPLGPRVSVLLITASS